MQSLHDAVQAVTTRVEQRERSTQSILTPEQRMKLAVWSTRNRDLLREKTSQAPLAPTNHKFHTSPNQHTSANMYIVNHQLQAILEKIPPASPVVDKKTLKKLSRRPLFESLGCQGEGDMTRENSSGSLKRSMSDTSMDGGEERVHIPSVDPQEAQAASAMFVEQTLGHLREIIPEPPVPAYSYLPTQLVLPAPTPVSSMTNLFFPAMSLGGDPAAASYPGQPIAAPLPGQVFNVPLQAAPPVAALPQQFPFAEASLAKHQRNSSFLPPHLNVVPEEMWTGDADDFLMNLVDGDWAIGEGIEMDDP